MVKSVIFFNVGWKWLLQIIRKIRFVGVLIKECYPSMAKTVTKSC